VGHIADNAICIGGNGGSADATGGNGGNGTGVCCPPEAPKLPGTDGGHGGHANADEGKGGYGSSVRGVDGISVAVGGNGLNASDGWGPGFGGGGGYACAMITTNGTDGTNGNWCIPILLWLYFCNLPPDGFCGLPPCSYPLNIYTQDSLNPPPIGSTNVMFMDSAMYVQYSGDHRGMHPQYFKDQNAGVIYTQSGGMVIQTANLPQGRTAFGLQATAHIFSDQNGLGLHVEGYKQGVKVKEAMAFGPGTQTVSMLDQSVDKFDYLVIWGDSFSFYHWNIIIFDDPPIDDGSHHDSINDNHRKEN
jgi:hypothetical protein